MGRINTSLKLYFLLAVMSVVVLIAGTYGIGGLKTLNQIIGTVYKDRLLPIRELSSVYSFYGSDLFSISSKLKKHELTYKEAQILLEESEQRAKDNWKTYQFTYLTPREIELIKDFNEEARRIEPILVKLKAILKSEDSVALDNFVLKELNQAIEPIGAKINQLIELQVKISEEKYLMSGEIYYNIKNNAYLFLALSLSFCLIVGCYIIKNVRMLIKDLELSNSEITHSENKFRKFIKNAGDAIFMIDSTYQITEVNDGACKLLNYSSEEFQNMKISELMTSGEQKLFQDKVKIVDAEGGSLHERVFVRKDGSLVDTEVNVNHVGKAGYIAVVRDITLHKKAEIKISESEEKFRLAFMTSTDAFFIGSLDDGHIIDVNDVFYEIFGYTKEEVIGKTILELNLFSDRSKRDFFFSEIKRKGNVKDFEVKCKRKNGKIITVSTSSSLWEMNGHQFILGVIRDITDRKKIEKKLIENEVRFREVLENSLSASYKRNLLTNTYDYLSPVFKKIGGYTQDEMNKMPLETVIGLMHPDDVKVVEAGIVKAINELNGLANSLEYRFKHKTTQEYRWFKDEFVVIQDEQGQVVSLIGSVSDITKDKESEILFKNLVEKSLIGVYIIQRGKFVYVNPKFASYLGYTQEEMYKMINFREIVDESYVPAELELWRQKVDSGIIEDFHIELKYKRKDGKIIWAEVFCGETIYNGSKALLGSFKDITERRLMEAERQKMLDEMLQRNRDLEQFAYIVSHNLRAPVANIIGISDYMLNPEMESDEKEEMNSGLRESVHRLDEVIKDLNNILQMKREISEKKEIVHFSEILDNIKLSIENLIEKEEVVFVSDFTEIDEMITIKSYLYSIFYNLISNSVKYRRPDVVPVIEIKSAVIEHKIVITYKDNGLGIDLAKKGEQVFGLYKRFHTHAEGKGMGLYMVKTQVETLGGSISIKSKINEGTEFKIEFEIEKNNH